MLWIFLEYLDSLKRQWIDVEFFILFLGFSQIHTNRMLFWICEDFIAELVLKSFCERFHAFFMSADASTGVSLKRFTHAKKKYFFFNISTAFIEQNYKIFLSKNV